MTVLDPLPVVKTTYLRRIKMRLVFLLVASLISSPVKAEPHSPPLTPLKTILVIVSSSPTLSLIAPKDSSVSTGINLSDLAGMLAYFGKKGYRFDFASPGGVFPTVDINTLDIDYYLGPILPHVAPRTQVYSSSYIELGNKRRETDLNVITRYLGPIRLSNPLPLSDADAVNKGLSVIAQQNNSSRYGQPVDFKSLAEINNPLILNKYAGVYIPGGFSNLEDLSSNPHLGDILNYMDYQGQVIALAERGTVALHSTLYTTNAPSKYLHRSPFQGRKITTVWTYEDWWFENYNFLNVPGAESTRMPFYVADALDVVGVEISLSWTRPLVVRDQNLVTCNRSVAVGELLEAFDQALQESKYPHTPPP